MKRAVVLSGGGSKGSYEIGVWKALRRLHIKYDIVKELGVLSENAKGWRKEVNLISWNGGAPKYDIRDWAPDHEKMGKGTTLSEEEMKILKEILGELL